MMLPRKRTPPDPALIREVYIDETSQTKHRFLLLGAICAPLLSRASYEYALSAARLPELPYGELKWAKVSKSKLDAYKRVADIFFEHPSFSTSHFHSLVVDTQTLNDKKYNEGKREIGFNKEIYQIAAKCAALYQSSLFHVYPDNRETDQQPAKLRTILNFGMAKKGDSRDFPFRRCQFRDSKIVAPLQLVDILLGAVAYQINGHSILTDASPAKIELSRHVLARAGITNPMRDTSRSGKFTIWHRMLRKGVPRA